MRFLLIATILLLSIESVTSQIKTILSKEKINLEYSDSVNFYKISYQSDSFIVDGFIVEPTYQKNNPIVVFNRGGNKNDYKINNNTLEHWIAPIALSGYTVFASQYRSKDEFGGKEVNDIINLINLAKNYPNVDSSKIGMVGWSRGGLMTYLALTKSKEIGCAIIGGAPTNMIEVIKARPRMENVLRSHIPHYDLNKDSVLMVRSPIMWINQLNRTNLLLLHGGLDNKVDVSHSQKMKASLDKINFSCKFIEYKEDDHILSKNWELKNKEIIDWLTKYLKD